MKEAGSLSQEERAAWDRFAAVLELLPGVLDAQLGRDAQLTYFEYSTLSALAEAPNFTLRMTGLAARTYATLPRLSRVVARLEEQGLVERNPCPEDGRATNATLTAAGWDKVAAAASGHVANLRKHLMDLLTPAQQEQLSDISLLLLGELDPERRLIVSAAAAP